MLVSMNRICQNIADTLSSSLKEDLEIPIPRYFIRERNQVLQERDKMFATVLNQMEPIDKPEVGPV